MGFGTGQSCYNRPRTPLTPMGRCHRGLMDAHIGVWGRPTNGRILVIWSPKILASATVKVCQQSALGWQRNAFYDAAR